MNFEINFDHMPDYVLIQTGGEISVDSFNDLLMELLNSPEWITGTSQIVDHRCLNLSDITPQGMRLINDIVNDYHVKLGDGPCAFVVKDTAGFGLVRMYEMLGGENSHRQVNVFYTMEEAVEWIIQIGASFS